jgi:hypothetical protein
MALPDVTRGYDVAIDTRKRCRAINCQPSSAHQTLRDVGFGECLLDVTSQSCRSDACGKQAVHQPAGIFPMIRWCWAVFKNRDLATRFVKTWSAACVVFTHVTWAGQGSACSLKR